MSGMTAEMLDNLDGGVDAGTDTAVDTPPAADAAGAPEGAGAVADAEAAATDAAAGEGAEGATEEAAVAASPGAFDQMKAYLRAQRMENAELRSKVEMLEKRVTAPPAAAASEQQPKYRVLYDEDGNEVRIPLQPAADAAKEAPAAESPRFMQLRDSLQEINQQKGAVLDTLYEVIVESPKYPNAEAVLQKQYFDDLFEAIATERAKEMKVPYEEALLETQIAVWKLPNPYKYMYNALTKYHPAFMKKQETPAPTPGQKTKEPPVVPTSLADMGAGTADAGTGWTAAKLDAMSEVELNKVPQDIIDKWLRNELK